MSALSSIIGQEPAIGALRRALESKQLPGAYLIVGAAGVGKSAVARALATAAACTSPRQNPFDACGACDSCLRLRAGTQPEVMTIRPAGEQMRIWQFWDRPNKPEGALTHTLAYAPAIGKRRIYILEAAETLTESAANSLLKSLEEPPPYVMFILLATHVSRMLPTIVSRSQVIRLHTMPIALLTDVVQERTSISRERALMLAVYAEGRIGQALRMVETPAVGNEIGQIMEFALGLPGAPRVRALRLAEQMRKQSVQIKALVDKGSVDNETSSTESSDESEGAAASPKDRAGRKQLAALFDLLQAFYRDLLALRTGGREALIVNSEHAAIMARLAQSGSPDRWSFCLDALLVARRRLDAKANISLVTEILAMTLVSGEP